MLRGGGPRSEIDRALEKFLFKNLFRGFCVLILATASSSLFAKIPNTPEWNKIKNHCGKHQRHCEMGFQLLEDLRHHHITAEEAERKVSDFWGLPVKADVFEGPRMSSWNFEAPGHFDYYLSWSLDSYTNELEMSVAMFYSKPLQNVLDFSYDKNLKLKAAQFSEYKILGERNIEYLVNETGDNFETLYYKDPTPQPLSKIYPQGFKRYSKTILVGLVDSGVDYNHPAIAKQILRDLDGEGNIIGVGKDFYDDDSFAFDLTAGEVRNHGTGVASIIASHSPQIMILPLRYTNSMDLREIIRYGHERGVRIFNFSLGFVDKDIKSENLKKTIRETADLYPDTLFIWAAGNELTDLDTFQGMKESLVFPNVVYVASVDQNYELDASNPGGSNYGRDTVDFAHFGVNQKVATPGRLSAVYSGTSFAAPQVTGMAAVLQLSDPGLKGSLLADALRDRVQSKPSLSGKLKFAGVPVLNFKNVN